ncbi:MAG: hypothetical protein LBL52_01620 [Rickettsiales bacterium]|jgi:hypothetical protein|nr:hypothetical protein [Rickettsiales bacterium]
MKHTSLIAIMLCLGACGTSSPKEVHIPAEKIVTLAAEPVTYDITGINYNAVNPSSGGQVKYFFNEDGKINYIWHQSSDLKDEVAFSVNDFYMNNSGSYQADKTMNLPLFGYTSSSGDKYEARSTELLISQLNQLGIQYDRSKITAMNQRIDASIVLGGGSLGMQYADFGYWKSVSQVFLNGKLIAGPHPEYDLFITVPRPESQIFDTSATRDQHLGKINFFGKAYAVVGKDGTDDWADFTGQSIFTIEQNGNEQLQLNFKDTWGYNITYKTDGTIRILGNNSKYYMSQAENATCGNPSSGQCYNHSFFGEGGIISETAGNFWLDNTATNQPLSVYGVFGAKRQ